jgi:hypothetical protein
MPLYLITFMNAADQVRLEAGGTHRGSDSRQAQVQRFCRDVSIPYSEDFTSVSVFDGHITSECIEVVRAYGPVAAVLRNDAVLPKIGVVSEGDFQDVTYHGNRQSSQRGKERYADLITVIEHAGEAEDKLSLAARRRRRGWYVEARTVPPITLGDVAFFAPTTALPIIFPDHNGAFNPTSVAHQEAVRYALWHNGIPPHPIRHLNIADVVYSGATVPIFTVDGQVGTDSIQVSAILASNPVNGEPAIFTFSEREGTIVTVSKPYPIETIGEAIAMILDWVERQNELKEQYLEEAQRLAGKRKFKRVSE